MMRYFFCAAAALLAACETHHEGVAPEAQPAEEALEVAPAAGGAPIPGAAGAVDLMLLMDGSCSMMDDQARFGERLGRLTDTLNHMGLDWQAMVVVDDDGCSNNGVIQGSTPGATIRLYDGVMDSGSPGSMTESLLELAVVAAEASAPGDCNEGFLREGALLHAVAFSDEQDQSRGAWSFMVNELEGVASDASAVQWSAIAGDVPGGCSSASAGDGYYQAVSATGGAFLSICASDYAAHMRELAFASR